MVDPEAMEIIRRRFTINPTQRRSRSRRRAGNKMLRKTGLLNYLLCRLFLTPSYVNINQLYLGPHRN
jgi:hypothetical protein